MFTTFACSMQRSFLFPEIEGQLSQQLQEKIKIENAENISGGCINECYKLNTNTGKYFLKKNDTAQFPLMFKTEAKGLQLLSQYSNNFIPKVILQFENEHDQYLILEYIEEGRGGENFWDDFAKQLSGLHKNTNDYFGLEHNNYIGSLVQVNSFYNSFAEFFILNRLQPLIKQSIDRKQLSLSVTKDFEKLFLRLDEIFPVEKPALIHGDLWSGNFMITEKGIAKLIDPAVAYSHRECDLAMTKLFGGFDHSFYTYYENYFPLEKEFSKRVDIYNLYPLLVHVILFGGSYAMQIHDIVKRF